MLIDTGVWIDWLRGFDSGAAARVDAALAEGTAWLAPVILQELLQGARSENEFTLLQREFGDQPMLIPSLETFILAGSLYARGRWQGVTIRSPHDCLIAALAVEYDVPLLTLDRDFQAISQIEPRLRLASLV